MKTIFIPIESEERDELERLHFEVNSRCDLVSYMIGHNMVDSNNEQYQKFFDEYQENYYLLAKYKDCISDKYTLNYPRTTRWEANFDACGIELTVYED